MRKTITVSGLNEAPFLGCYVEVDAYVPLRFRSYEGILGVKYLRLGNFSSSLLEFLLDPSSMAIRGFTLTSFDAVHQPKVDIGLPRLTGLPVVAIAASEDFKGPIDAQRVDIRTSFSIGFGGDFVEIDLSGISQAKRIIADRAIEFYVDANSLVGLRVTGLTQEQISTLRSQQIE
jgi:hypothetical protein